MSNRESEREQVEECVNQGTEHEYGYPTLQAAWVWPDRIQRLFREEKKGRTLHVCCGQSDIGDVTVDADPDRDPDVQADMFALPFADCSFDTVIADPPWKVIAGIGKTHRVFFELLRVLKPNGIVLWNAYSVPSSDQAKLEQTWVRQDYEEGRASFIGRYRRFPDQTTLSRSTAATDGGSP